MPGINDAHVHLADAGQNQARGRSDGLHFPGRHAAPGGRRRGPRPPGQWLLGGGWDHTLWTGQTLPTRQDLDTVSRRSSGVFRPGGWAHCGGQFSRARPSGVTKQTPNPPGSQFDHDAHGELTGIVREDRALDLIQQHIPPPTHEMRRQAILLALEDAAAHGVTSVQDNSDWDDFLVYQELEREGKLTVRISEWLRFDDPVDVLVAHRAAHPAGDRMLHTGMLKGFMDGSLGSRTAALLSPYADDPGQQRTAALPAGAARCHDQRACRRRISDWLSRHWRPGGGDGSQCLRRRGPEYRGFPPNASESSIPRWSSRGTFRAIRLWASSRPCSPAILLTDMNWAQARLGPQRARYAYAMEGVSWMRACRWPLGRIIR